MPGMRLAAERIVSSLKRLDFAEEPPWAVTATQRLPGLMAGAPAGESVPLEAEGVAYEERKPKVGTAKCTPTSMHHGPWLRP